MTNPNPYQPPEYLPQAPEPVATADQPGQPAGLGGWLILVAIGLIISPLRLAAVVVLTYFPLFQDGIWDTLTTPGGEQYHPLWAPLLIFEIVCNLGFIIAYTTLVLIFFRKSRYFPKVYIVLAIINLCFMVLDAWLVSFVLPNQAMFDPDTVKEVSRALVSAAVWIPYMLVSKRVKNTFVH